jgi:hypothetical protein
MEVHHKKMMDMLRADQGENKACLKKRETNEEEIEVMAEHWEVPKEDAEPKRANTGTGF